MNAVTISSNFGDLGITISNQLITDMEKFAIQFTLRRTHPLTFDGPYLGVHPVAFTTSDYNTLFDICKVSKADVEHAIRATPSIDRTFAVISEPFNLLCIWLVHLAPIYIKNKTVCYNFQINVLRIFHYRIFTSVVNNSFRHGTNEGILQATVANMSRKSDIVRYESWRRLIDAHCEKILDPHDRFYKTVVDGSPDDMFLRVISENQTSLRAKIVTYAQAYYEAYNAGDSMGSRSATAENAEGEKILAQTASVIDSATQSMVAEILNPNMFIHDISIDDVAKLFSTISPRMLKTALLRINETALLQVNARTFDKVRIDKEGTVFIGVRALVIEIIRSTVRMARDKRVNMGQRAAVFKVVRDAYSSSRSLDKDVIAIKRSVTELVDSFNITTNQASQAALRLAVIYYITYKALVKMK